MDSEQERLSRLLFTILLPLDAGTLWWGREDLLQEATAGTSEPYPGSTRTGHPLVLITDVTPERFFHPLPGLIGFTRAGHCAFTAKGLSPETKPDFVTEFSSKFHPLIPFHELYSKAPDADRNVLAGGWSKRSRLSRNHHKPALDDAEMEKLRSWKQKIERLS